MRLRPTIWTSAALLTTASLTAQQEESTTPSPLADNPSSSRSVEQDESSVPAAPLPRLDALRDHRTPIHTAADDPEGGAYGVWAAGSDYKASFHGDFTFIPYLGGGYPENRPFSWRTVSATVGGKAVTNLEAPSRHHRDYRYEYRFAGLTEAYDVRVDGVEQTFVLALRPNLAGDLVVSGALTTSLAAAPVVDRHGEIVFADARGNAIVHYGAAIAFDARGARTQVFTTWDGSRIHLRVPGDWLAAAAFPVTIDPLLTRNCVAFWTTANPPPTSGRVLDVEIGRDDIANDVMVAYTRQASATDSDMWAFLFTSDSMSYASRNLIFTDLSNSWGNASPAIAFAGGAADSWILAFIRPDVGGPGVNGVRYHLHASGNTASNTSFSSISRPMGSSHGDVVDVGGVMSNSTGSRVFVCYERDDAGAHREVLGKPINLNGNVQGTEVLIDTTGVGTARTRTRPNINQVAQSGSDGWVVAFQEYWDARPGGDDDWDINIRRITGAGTPTGSIGFPSNSTPDTYHKLSPTIAGAAGRYSLGMTLWAQPQPRTATATDRGTDIWNETFDWPVSSSRTFVGIDELTAGLVSDRRWRITGSTHDTNTDSHWVFAFESTVSGSQYACSVGYDAGRIERLIAYSPPGTPIAFAGAVTFNDDRNEFQLAYATNEGGIACGPTGSTNHVVYAQIMQHLPEPPETRYGTACGPGMIGWSGRNLAGVRSYSITLQSATPLAPAALLLGLQQAATPLDPFGMTGCTLYVDLATLITSLPTSTNSAGSAVVSLSLPTNPSVVCGSLYWQWAYPATGVNPLGIAATQGLLTPIACP